MLIGRSSTRRPHPAAGRYRAAPPPSEPRALVAVLLGEGRHHFDRLVQWVADLAHDPAVDVFVQHGATSLPPAMDGAASLGTAARDDLLDRAWAVVTHGGAAEILAGRTHGHRPVVVARIPELGEHGDDHQRRSVTRLAERGLCVTASSRDSLRFEVGSVLVARGLPLRSVHDLGARDPAVLPPSPEGSSWRP